MKPSAAKPGNQEGALGRGKSETRNPKSETNSKRWKFWETATQAPFGGLRTLSLPKRRSERFSVFQLLKIPSDLPAPAGAALWAAYGRLSRSARFGFRIFRPPDSPSE